MAFAGLGVTLAGFALAVSSLGFASGNGARLGMTLVGIAMSLYGILGIINPTYQKSAVWKR
ncbi:MAG: hypothetical protein M3O78_07575 [Chloroflexota bacterium]|jgi:hypothetical protein|nr:hypothetical protein [Chloroflexota bacterium]